MIPTISQRRKRLAVLVHTTMSSLPPEIHDIIVDHLHDEPTALKACCIVSKSWVPRVRTHLFAHVEFNAENWPIERWMKAFPDPSNSPAHHTRILSVHGTMIIGAANVDAGGWIGAFCNVVHFRVSSMDRASLVPFYGFSPVLRSLSLNYLPFSIDLVCSFPLLEDLELFSVYRAADGSHTRSTSPKLTGTLKFTMYGSEFSVIRRLLDLPGGLYFSKITLRIYNQAPELMTDLVSRCSDSLEFLTVRHFSPGAFSPILVIDQDLTTTCSQRDARGAFA